MHSIDFIDSHTEGEPTRVVTAGFPDLGNGSLAARLRRFRDTFDHWRSGIVLEPRGSDAVVGALLLPPVDPDACTGVIFFNNAGYLGMCGHGTIGVVRTLRHMGRIGSGWHRIETPVGTVSVELLDDGRVAVDNIESYRLAANVEVDVPGSAKVRGDVAWGGNWFFITHDAPCAVTLANRGRLTVYAEAVRAALVGARVTGTGGAEIDHIEINQDITDGHADARNFVLCPGMAYDRSPCGTGTSAKLACMAADGRLAPGEVWRQAGIRDTVFEASYRPGTRGVLPRIVGRAWITGAGRLLFEDDDPLADGIAA
ncbi:MAG TPA: proline racemase family protein [Rhodanobacteraceae bacterium]